MTYHLAIPSIAHFLTKTKQYVHMINRCKEAFQGSKVAFLYSSTMCKPRNVRTSLSFSFRDCHYLLPYMVHKIFACNYSTQDIESCIIFLPLNLTSCYTGETFRKQKDAFSEIFEIL